MNVITIIRSLLACRNGMAVTEAAFFAPIFVLSGLAVFDLGVAGSKRMQLDQALRAGAQVSMINVTDELEIMNATLAALGESELGEVDQGDGLCEPYKTCVNVDYSCECSSGVASPCNQLCVSSGEAPSAYLTIVASRRHEGMLLPDMNLETQIVVQTR